SQRAHRREAVEDGFLRDQRPGAGGRAAQDGWPGEMENAIYRDRARNTEDDMRRTVQEDLLKMPGHDAWQNHTLCLLVGVCDVNAPILDLHAIGAERLARWPAQHPTVAHIEPRQMNRTGEHMAIQFALVERAAGMCAVIIHGVDDAIDIGQTDEMRADLHA